jgi:hypothetical protein
MSQRPTVAKRAEHIARTLAFIVQDLTAESLRVEDMALFVGILKVSYVLFDVVVIFGSNRRGGGSFAGSTRPVRTARHSALKPRGDAKSLLTEALGLAQGLAPSHTSEAIVVAVNVDGDVDFDKPRILLDAQFRGLAVGGLGERLVGRAVQVLEDVELLLRHVGGDVDVVLGHNRVVVFDIHSYWMRRGISKTRVECARGQRLILRAIVCVWREVASPRVRPNQKVPKVPKVPKSRSAPQRAGAWSRGPCSSMTECIRSLQPANSNNHNFRFCERYTGFGAFADTAMAYIAPIHRPSSVRHALKLNFLAPEDDCLVVA